MMNKNLLRGLCLLCLLALAAPCTLAEIDMLAVDRKLYELGYRDEACNGVLDEVTINALKSFQRANGLEITGEPDGKTVDLLLGGRGKTEREYLSTLAYKYSEATVLAKGAYGDQVTQLQRALKKLGYFRSETDGAYGEATEAAVYRFQMANGLMETGIADGPTQLRLYEGSPILWEDFLSQSCAVAGDSGSHVRRLQRRLSDMGYFSGKCSGRYGEATQQAVRHFQSVNKLEVTGDANLESCKLLYSQTAVALTDAQTLRRGSVGAEAELMCNRLQELGYSAADEFNLQTEIALLKFQLASGLEPTGALDSKTAARLNAADAAAYNAESWRSQSVSRSTEQSSQLVKLASSKLGTVPEAHTSFEFVQHLHLCCGIFLMEEAQLEMVQLADRTSVSAGDLLLISSGSRSFYGVATADGAVIYRSDEGYAVMSYLSMLDAREVYIWMKGVPHAG